MGKSTVHVPKKALFQLVGRGGSVVRMIQRNTGAKVTIPAANSQSTGVEISGSDESVRNARQAIEEVLGFSVSDAPLTRIALDVHRRDHGTLVGRGGSVVRDLEKRFSSNINIPRRHEKTSLIEIEGPADKIEALLAEIGKLLSYAPKQVAPGSGGGGRERKEDDAPKVDYSKPINESLFFPDTDMDDGWNFDRFLSYLKSASKSIDVCVFTLSDNAIANILRDKHRAGVKVRIMSDNECVHNKGADIKNLAEMGIPVKLDVSEYHMHHKFCVVDDALLINGSFNWTYSASRKNAENITITTHRAFVEDFKEQFAKMWADEKSFEELH